jgi:hypothetical protein
VSAPTLDRDRLVRDLRAAADVVDDLFARSTPVREIALAHMARAWRIVAAAVEDGEYDLERDPDWSPPTRAQMRRVDALLRERHGLEGRS